MRKIYYYIEFENISPIHIGNGDNTNSDLDVIKDQNDQFYIPGSSLAGCIAHSLNEENRALFQPKINNEQYKQSPFIINDARMITKNDIIEVRNGIRLSQDKTTEYMAKYDYEVVPRGQHFEWVVEIIDRDQKAYETLIENVLKSVKNQDIRVGYKTTRGLGRLEIIKSGKRIFDQNNFDDYFHFDRYDFSQYHSFEIEHIASSCYKTIEVDLIQKGGLSIRTYNASQDDIDFEHIHSLNKPIIPATSWNGLLRRSLDHYIDQLKLHLDIRDIFGGVLSKDETETHEEIKMKSKVLIEEGTLDKGECMTQTRIKMNSFYSGTEKGSLYKEKSYYHGTTTLTMYLSRDIQHLELVEKLFILTFIDLDHGFIALGGETSIGRGLFEVKEIRIDHQKIDIHDYIKMEESSC